MVTSAAYLLFYRRRSDVPLGGPKFQEIFERYSQGPVEDMSESGEGQRLGQGSSQRGSPSASTGAGLTLPREGRGWDRRSEFEQSTSYTDFDTDLAPWNNESGLHTSIEADGEDEGIGLADYDTTNMAGMTSVIGPSNWSFDNLAATSKEGSDTADAIADDDDLASDVAQNDGSSVNGDMFDGSGAGRSMESLLYREPGADYVEPPEPSIEFADDYNDAPPPPSAENQDYISRIAAQSWVNQQIHTVPPVDALGSGVDDDQASDKVAEIHVGDADEGTKPRA